ncbi:MAG TPA: DUF3667 domain-containing protein [Sphingomicrobium sp.]|nr:DUF3667 domain-containing protein [Sphingomicrobium sp.]
MPDREALDSGTSGVAEQPTEQSRDDGHTHETRCLNCGADLTGPYCAMCGQHAHVHRTLGAWWHDFLHSVLHIDGKFWRTVQMLVIRPGELTRRYVHGERAKFVSPLALFLFSVFAMFAIFTITGSSFEADAGPVKQGLQEELRDLDRQIANSEQERAAAEARGADTGAIDRRIDNLRQEAELFRTVRDQGLARGSAVRISDDVPAWLKPVAQKAAANPELLLYKMQANAYKFSWALIPISVPFVWILFLHRRRYRRELTSYDHLVFVTYSLSFATLLIVSSMLLGRLYEPLAPLVMLAMPVHIYRQLRGAYAVGRFAALWRTAALLLFATLAIAFFVVMLAALGAF